jgi:hypothetical protein
MRRIRQLPGLVELVVQPDAKDVIRRPGTNRTRDLMEMKAQMKSRCRRLDPLHFRSY